MQRMNCAAWRLTAFVLATAAVSPQIAAARQAGDAVLVTVNGAPITESDLEFLMISRSIPAEAQAGAREALIGQLVDRRLMRGYLEQQQAVPEESAVDAQVARIHDLIRKGGDEPQVVLSKLGFDEARLRAAVALPLAWRIHVRRTVTGQQLREHFAAHRQEFDGTEIRASQIFFKLPADADDAALKQATEKLAGVRQEILDGKTTFADAARAHSQAPSGAKGGDVGYFAFRGKMPVEFSRAAFPLKKGEISQPLRTRFGLHLLAVTDRRPGQLSLEDVRGLVYNALAQQAWSRLIEEQRKQAKIERPATQ